MAYDKVVDSAVLDAGLTAIADSIKEKSNTSDALLFPDGMVNAIKQLGSGETIPTYCYEEAFEVAQKIADFKEEHPNHFIVGTISDNHVYVNNATYEELSKASVLHGAFALETVGAMVESDCVADLGDKCWENGSHTDNAYQGSLYVVNVTKPFHERLTSFSLVGNHDKNDNTQTIYDLIGQYNDFDVWANTKIRSFGYKDFARKKVRVIVLNTCDYLNASGGCALSYEQKDFLMRALDLSAKTDYADWQLLILSHIPIDWNGGDYNFHVDLRTILDSYVNGTTASIAVNNSYALNENPSEYATYSGGKLVYDYSGKNSAKIIANIHGHVHTDAYGKMTGNNILRMATPNTCFYLGKTESYPDYGDYGIDEAIARSANTATDTSATFYCVDLDDQVIYAYAYGAGADRTAIYKDATVYTITYNLTSVSVNNTIASIIEGKTYVTTITPDTECKINSVVVTMGDIDITSTVYDSTTNTINIANVTGNVVITAVAKAEAWSQVVSDVAGCSRSIPTSATAIDNSNDWLTVACSTPNDYTMTDRESKIRYSIPVPAKAKKVIISTTDSAFERVKIIGAKNGGDVFNSGEQSFASGYSYSFEQGSADYMLIGLAYDSSLKVAWNYDISQVTVTFSN